MCGIAGIITPNAKAYDSISREMIRKLRHRGPDDERIHFFNNCVLGHTRLSIVDIKLGSQPMLDKGKSRGIIFNGEIYGYQKIRDELKREYDFRTNSDTEVILALHEKFGANCLKYLPGMFSFAIWDDRKQELFCARDRFGEKPFYYALGPKNQFIFASEIKAIISTDLLRPVLDLSSVAHYLRYLYVHPYKTIYKNICVLPPAHSLTLKNGEISIERYWQPPIALKSMNLSDAVEKFRLLFSESIKQCLVADVPVGIFLSGGLDSSSIVAEASKINKNLTTFSFGFHGKKNELPYARMVSNKFNTKHFEHEEKDFNIGELMMKMQKIFDEPFADSANIPTYIISSFASKKLKVVLSGEGSDELLGGYEYWYRTLVYLEKLNSEPLLEFIYRLLLKYYHFFNRSKFNNLWRAFDFSNDHLSIIKAHRKQISFFNDGELREMQLPVLSENYAAGGSNINDVLNYDIQNYLPGDILVKTDRTSMSNGLEIRSPFLYVDLAEFCLSLPSKFKVTSNSDKIILRRAMQKDWPSQIRRRGKQGFGAPVHDWLEQDGVSRLKEDFLHDQSKKIFDILPHEVCRKYIERNDYKTWILLNLSLWLESG